MSVTILLVRHGETDWNRRKIFRGIHDVPLNENGRAQARHLAKAMASHKIVAAYSSPLCRSLETANIVLQSHGIEATVHEGLKDFSYGDWTGLEDGVVAKRWPEEHACWISEPAKARPPGGDTLEDVFHRASACLESIVKEHAGQTVALFSHRVVNKVLILGMLSLGLERFNFIRQDNCCVNEFERIETGYIAVRLNDTCHIRQAGTELLKVDF